jgi:large subunit ribosomal protein L13
MKTYHPTQKEIKREWHLMDAKGATLGRLTTQIAGLLQGKHKATYSPHMDSGDNVVVVNAEKVKVTGRKAKQKIYYSHSGYPGGLKEIVFEKLQQQHPERIIQKAVFGMLPDNRLRDDRMKRLKVIAGEKHPYESQMKGK